MALQSVTTEDLPPLKPQSNDSGFDRNSPGEKARWALNGAEAIGTIRIENSQGETKDHWSDNFIWMLHQGQEALLAFARQQVDALEHELWYMHALHGDYGAEIEAKARRELGSQQKEAA